MEESRSERGRRLAMEIAGVPMAEGSTTPMADAARDFVFGEVWNRPGLDRRSRLWITLACVVATGAPVPVKIYAGIAAKSGLVTMEEMREFVLHFAMYQGFPKSTVMEMALNEVEAELAAQAAPK
ncbi:MAG: carboxymuconolactone decarboxylase family protein [Novosphingobium sp.]|nr:carboxymuconolactone decarboxylase family protein [Novosphingobium sp.]